MSNFLALMSTCCTNTLAIAIVLNLQVACHVSNLEKCFSPVCTKLFLILILQKMKIGMVWLPRKASNHIHLRHTNVAAKIVIHELTHVKLQLFPYMFLILMSKCSRNQACSSNCWYQVQVLKLNMLKQTVEQLTLKWTLNLNIPEQTFKTKSCRSKYPNWTCPSKLLNAGHLK